MVIIMDELLVVYVIVIVYYIDNDKEVLGVLYVK